MARSLTLVPGGAGVDEAADALQRGISVVAPQNVGGVKPGGAERGEAVLIDKASGGVGRAVGPVGAEGEDGGLRKPGKSFRSGQRNLLIASAASGAGQMHDRLASGEKRKRLRR